MKEILIGVTGSIAAYKMPSLARNLIKKGYGVCVMMTKNSTEFITPYTFETLTKRKCLVDTFDKNFEYSVEHVSAARAADCVIIAPASANVIAKLANGIADDMLTTTVLAADCKKIIAPAMNHYMFHNPVVQDNIKKLESYGWTVIPPERGILANGDAGDGRMPEIEVLEEYVLQAVEYEKDLQGLKVVVTAGACCEDIDPVRYITNHSSGKMGCALAKAASRRGAEVTLVTANISCKTPYFVDKVVSAVSAEKMYETVTDLFKEADVLIMSAAVADFTPETTAENKIKKAGNESLELKLKKTKDIIKKCGEIKKENQVICGFSMETENLIANSEKKLISKNIDFICANSINIEGAGFQGDTNIITIISRDGKTEMPMMSKDDVSHKILDAIKEKINKED